MATAPSGTRSACRPRRSMCGATRVTAVPIALATRSNVLRDGGQRWSAFMSSSALRIWSFAYDMDPQAKGGRRAFHQARLKL